MSGQNTPQKSRSHVSLNWEFWKMYFFWWLQESVCNLELLNPVPKRYFKAHTRICLIDTKNSSHQDDPETWFQVRSSVIANRKVEAFLGLISLSCRIILSAILTKLHDVATCLYGTEIDCQWMTLLAVCLQRGSFSQAFCPSAHSDGTLCLGWRACEYVKQCVLYKDWHGFAPHPGLTTPYLLLHVFASATTREALSELGATRESE